MRSRLRNDTALYGAAVLFERALGLLLLPLLARAMDRADYGAWTQTAVAAGMLMPVVLFALPTTIVRSFAAELGAAVRLRFFRRLGALVLALFAAVALTLWLARDAVAGLVYGDAAGLALLPALLLLAAADAVAEFALAWLRALGRMGSIAAWTAARCAWRYALLLAILGLGPQAPLAQWLAGYAVAQLLLAAGVLGHSLIVLRREPPPQMPAPPPRMTELLRFSAPLVALALFTLLGAGLDRFLLVHVLGLGEVAVYAAAAALCGIPAVFYTVLGYTLFPVLARHWNAGEFEQAAQLTRQSLQVFVFLCLPAATLLALAGPALLPLLTTAEYRAAPAVFALLGVSVTAFGGYQILLYTLLLAGRSHQVLLLAMAAAALNLVLNLLLTPRLGLVGAATAAALSNTLMLAVASRLARRIMPWRFPWALLAPSAGRTALAALPAGALLALMAPTWTVVGLALALGVLAYAVLDLARPGSLLRTLSGRESAP